MKYLLAVCLFCILAAGLYAVAMNTNFTAEQTVTTDTPARLQELSESGLKTALFAGGCFWCMESAFEGVNGVVESISGYSGGSTENPSYYEVAQDTTGHFETVLVFYDPELVSYNELLETFWRNIDPTDDGGQFADRGSSYKTAIFYADETERELAEASKDELAASGKFSAPIATQILNAGPFYPAEEEHQNYYLKRAAHYERYSKGSGRTGFIEQTWGPKEK